MPIDVDVVLDRLPRGLLRRLEQRADVDVEAEVGEAGGDDLGAAVVAVLAELGDHDPRPAALVGGEGVDLGLEARPRAHRRRTRRRRRRTRSRSARGSGRRPSPARRRSRRRSRAARVACTASASRLPAPLCAAAVSAASAAVDRGGVARGADGGEARQLRLAHRGVVDLAGVERVLVRQPVLVDADDDVVAAVDPRLLLGRRTARSAAWPSRSRPPWSCRPSPRPPR